LLRITPPEWVSFLFLRRSGNPANNVVVSTYFEILGFKNGLKVKI